MRSSRTLTAAISLVALLAFADMLACVQDEPTEEDVLNVEGLNTMSFGKDPLGEASKRIMTGWGEFQGSAATALDLSKLEETFEKGAIFEQQKKWVLQFTQLRTFDQRKCLEMRDTINELLQKYRDVKANLVPFLKTRSYQQDAFCAHAEVGETSNSVPPLREELVTPATKDDVVMPDETDDTSADVCDAACMAKELDLQFSTKDAGEQTDRMLKSATFKKALRFVYKLDGRADDVERFPQASRKLVAMLEEAERQDGKLDEPLNRLRDNVQKMLDACTPNQANCHEDKIFKTFAKVFPDYRQLARRGTMRVYAEECLAAVNLYCAYAHPE
jgi:hypothetical protein